MNNLINSSRYFLFITVELTVLFLGISTVVSLTLMHIPREKLRQWLLKRGIWGNVLGAVVGSLTPFCACSTIPMTLGMLHAGAPFGPVMSFIIASPLLNPIILSMVATLMGLKACLLYFGITFMGSILFGLLLGKTSGAQHIKNVRLGQSCCGGTGQNVPSAFKDKIFIAFMSAVRDFRPVLVYLLVGVGIGAVIYGYIPREFIARVAGEQNPFAVPLAAVIGIPLYIRAETAIPLGLALASKGMSLGAVIALIIGGAGMAIPEVSMLASIFHKKLVAAIIAVIFLTAVSGGYAFNFLM